jgi:hypothetical protein
MSSRHIFIQVHCVPELANSTTRLYNMVSALNFLFLQFNLINRNVSHIHMSGLHSWLSGQSVATCKREIAADLPVLFQKV